RNDIHIPFNVAVGHQVQINNVNILGRQNTFFVTNSGVQNRLETNRQPRTLVTNSYIEVGDYIYIPGIKAALDNPGTTFKGYVIHEDAPVTEITLYMESLTAEEREIIKAGSLINFNKNRQM
ncbi:hypothetical protein ACUOFC_34605, partial [Escherichia sp. TWPC-MK]